MGSVQYDMGANKVSLFVTLGVLLYSFVLALQPAHADVVTDWNRKATALVYSEGIRAGQQQNRALAIMHVAMFDVVNSIDGRYSPYRTKHAADPATSKEANATTAAYSVLVKLFPRQQAWLGKDYDASLAAVPEGQPKSDAIALGEKVAAEILASRAGDGSEAPEVYKPSTTAGVYVPTAIPIFSTWGRVKPWAMKQGSQVRPDPPPALSSTTWARDYNEVKELGRNNSARRTADQTDAARFWLFTGPATYNPIALQLSAARNLGLVDNARMLALLAIASADAPIAIFDAKYAYNFWRPITAIRNGDLDRNDAIAPEADWTPRGDTPMHPEYPCAHCVASTTAGEVLKTVFGAGEIPQVSLTSPTARGGSRVSTTTSRKCRTRESGQAFTTAARPRRASRWAGALRTTPCRTTCSQSAHRSANEHPSAVSASLGAGVERDAPTRSASLTLVR